MKMLKMKPITINTFLIFVTCFFCMFINDALCREKKTFSLTEVRDYAVKNSTKTKNARLDVAIAKKKIRETTALGLPQVNASVSYQDMVQLPTTLIPAQIFDPDAEEGTFLEMQFGTQHNVSLEVSASQLIFQGSYIVALQASQIFLRLSQESLIKSEIEVKETVTKTYYLVLLAENTKKNLESNLENLKKILFETGELFKAGFAEDTDVDQVQLTITDLTNSIKSVNRQISITRKLLKFQMGINLEEKIELSENLENILNKINSADILAEEFNIINHIDYRILETREKSLFFLLKKEKSEFLPTLSAFITYQGNAMRNEFNFFKKTGDKWFPATIIGINIAVPIFSSGSRAAKIRQAKLELKKAKNDKKNVKKGLKLDLLQARYDFSSALEKSGNTEKNVLLAKKIYAKTLVKYRQGISSSLELTQTHNQYLQSQAKHTNAVVELLNSKVKLDKALNKL